MKKNIIVLLIALVAVSLFVGCKEPEKTPESTNADYFIEAYKVADFVLNDFANEVFGYTESSNEVSSGSYPMNTYWGTYYADPIMETSSGEKLRGLFTNKAKTKRIGISKITNYGTDASVNGELTYAYQTVVADGINLEFKYKNQTSEDSGTTWTDSGDEKTGYLVCNAKRTKEAVEGSTTKFKYTITDLKLSVKAVDGELLDVSSKDAVSYKSISYVIDGTDVSKLESLTFDGKALSSDEIAAVIKELTK